MKEDPNNELERVLRKRFSDVEVEGPKDTWGNISNKLDEQKYGNTFSKYKWYMIAACLVGIAIVSSLFVFNREVSDKGIAKNSSENSRTKEVFENNEPSRVDKEKEKNSVTKDIAQESKPKRRVDREEVITLGKFLTFKSENEKTRHMLPDSSIVYLNRNSKIYYKNDFNKKDRVVNLEGEGYFEVKKNPAKPFLIEGFRSTTKVIGTSFNLRTLQREQNDEIEVVTGKVEFALKDLTESIVLLPGDKGTANLANATPSLTKLENSDLNFMAWKTEKLTFQKSNLQNVLSAMERYFDVKIKVANPDILKCTFSGTFTTPQMKDILDVIAMTRKITYVQAEEEYILSGEGCK